MKIALTAICVLLGLMIAPKLQAQNSLFGPSISYQYQKGSILKTGVYYCSEINTKNLFKIDATANFSWIQNKSTVIPEVAGTYYSAMYIIGLLGRAEFTPYTITPKVGFTILTLLELDFGYGFAISDKKNYSPIKGFATSLRFNIPINSRL
ncbi:hypothetical protein [Sphingobacterium tabacisoli]|uniref:DUF3575 domain-containing protein n=1 Tax=Sphingobacterium tabacisoli TaxID=2044855 RepID=A0ABW5L8G5_9SPHI|nr:hypothetical protein [Sphingobacterium tabacisoli]